MQTDFLKVYTYVCNDILGRYKLLFGAELSDLQPKEIEKCAHSINLKQKSRGPIPHTTLEKAAVLLYELLHRHISNSKRDRFACIAFLLFLYERGFWIELNHKEFYALIEWIKFSPDIAQKETVAGILKLLKASCYPLDNI
ncbi:MAG TPA: hypothetical protein VJH67_01550 [Candidatus Paceibacterota bacterium]